MAPTQNDWSGQKQEHERITLTADNSNQVYPPSSWIVGGSASLRGTTSPITAAFPYPASWSARSTAAATSGFTAASRPPEVCGSNSQAGREAEPCTRQAALALSPWRLLT